MSLLENKNILIMGVSNKWSIAWGIAKACSREGANLIFTYEGERTERSVKQLLSSEMPDAKLYKCNVTDDMDILRLFDDIKNDIGTLHGVVHSLAFAKKEELEGNFSETSRDGYLLAQNISSYSLVAVSRYAKNLMTEGGGIITLTYIGGERAVPNYNVMGVAKAALESAVRYLAAELGENNIRVNSISAGPIKTISARGVSNFTNMLKQYERKVPLGRTVTQEEVGNTAAFLLSDLSQAITGENIHVDAGYHILGL